MLSLILLMAHFWSCGFLIIGYSELKNENWITHFEFENLSPLDLYINTMYFSIITMVSVGYGDISPINRYERIYISLMAVFSSMNFAFVVNTIGSIFAE